MRADLRVCGVLVFLGLLAQFAPLPPLVAAVLVAPLVVFLPGYLVLRATFVAPRPPLEMICLAIGLSLAFVVLTGVALHIVGRLDRLGWSVALGTISVAGMLSIRTPINISRSALPILRVRQMAMVVLGLVLAVMGLYLNRAGYLGHKEFKYTEFWLAPARERGGLQYTLGLKNHEQQDVQYQIELRSESKLLGVWNGISLRDGESWTQRLQLPVAHASGNQQRAEALLFASHAKGEVYRKVWTSFVNAVGNDELSLDGPRSLSGNPGGPSSSPGEGEDE